jgi:hypothetical protein
MSGAVLPVSDIDTVIPVTTPSSPTRLIVLRGNSASGKSSVATGLRERYGRGIALVRQDVLRREVLRERDIPGGANIGLIDLTVRHALAHGFHTVLEGILYVAHYGEMLAGLLADHPTARTATTSTCRSRRPCPARHEAHRRRGHRAATPGVVPAVGPAARRCRDRDSRRQLAHRNRGSGHAPVRTGRSGGDTGHVLSARADAPPVRRAPIPARP